MLCVYSFTSGVVRLPNVRDPLTPTVHARGPGCPSVLRWAREGRVLWNIPREHGLFPVFFLLKETYNDLPREDDIRVLRVG